MKIINTAASLIVSLAFISTTPAAFAENFMGGDISELSLEELLNLEITVASKTRETLGEAPSSVTVFTHDEIIRMGVTNLEDILNYVPGFQATRDVEQGRANRISSRGKSTALSESVLFLINGQRMNDLYTGGISVINRHIPLENIKQVEIIRGPGSALYGSNAFLGVVNIITLDEQNSIQLNAGNLNSRSGAVNLSAKINDNLQLSSFIKGFSDEGFIYPQMSDIYGLKRDTSDPVRGYDIFTTIKFNSLSVNVRHMERNLRNFLIFSSINNYSNDENTRQSSVNLNYELKLADNLGANIFAGYSMDRWQTLGLAIPAGIEAEGVPKLENDYITGPLLESSGFNTGFDAYYQPFADNNLIAGVVYEQASQTDVKNVANHNLNLEYLGRITEMTKPEENFNILATRHILGAYIQDKHDFGDFLSLTAGLRLDGYSDFGLSLNPRAAIIYKTPFSSNLKFMYGKAFRAPNFLELYDKNNPVDFGNRNLKPETVQTFEVSYVQNLKMMEGSLTFFHNNINDLIQLDAPVEHEFNPLEAPGFVNKGTVNINGLELELKASPLENLFLRGTFTHLFQNNLDVPQDFASFIINYKIMAVNLNLNGIFRSRIEKLASQAPYFVLNSAVSYEFAKGLKLQANIQNILDTDYRTVTKVELPGGVPNRGRTFNLGLYYEL